jgi:hypothetical protein
MVDTKTSIPTLAEFLEAIDAHRAQHGEGAMEVLLRKVATHVPEEQRVAVLASLAAVTSDSIPLLTMTPAPDQPPESLDFELANSVNQFVRHLEDGCFFEGTGWDEELNEERAWGDESWARQMDDLFGRAATTYLSENRPLSAYVYGRLLGAFRHMDRPGIFCGAVSPDRMIQTDLNEAKRRYFRGMYEVTAPDERAPVMLALMESFRRVGDMDVGLAHIADMEGEPVLDSIDVFLPQWIEGLRNVDTEEQTWRRMARRLLREAVAMYGGVEGLGTLAQEDGRTHPEVYHDWVGLLVQQNRFDSAIVAAKQGVQCIEDPTYRARLADRLALLAHTTRDPDLAVEATRAAWRTVPTLVRLLLMVAATERANVKDVVLAREAADVLRSDWEHGDGLACRLLLLAGDHSEAMTRFENADARGWGHTTNPGSVVLPFLLLASTDLSAPPEGSVLASLWADLDAQERNYFDRRLLQDRLTTGSDTGRHPFDHHRPFSELLLEAIASHPIPDTDRTALLGLAQLKVEAVIREVLEGQHRRGEILSAHLAIACAEAIALSQQVDDAIPFVEAIRRDYADYSILVSSLDDLQKQTPVLPDSEESSKRPALILLKS